MVVLKSVLLVNNNHYTNEDMPRNAKSATYSYTPMCQNVVKHTIYESLKDLQLFVKIPNKTSYK